MSAKRSARRRSVRKEIFERDGYRCVLCGWRPTVPDNWDGIKPLTDGKRVLTIDHIIEKALGGPSTRDNFRAACDRCNTKRSVHVGKLVREGQSQGLSLDSARLRAAVILGLIFVEIRGTVSP